MGKKAVMILTLLIASALSLALSIQPAEAAAQINLLSNSGWLDSSGYYHVSGEVLNAGDGSAEFVKVNATFYDLNDVAVATEFSYTLLNVIPPGRKAPFEIILYDVDQSANVYNYSLTVSFSATSSTPEGLQIVSNSSYIDSMDMMRVVGEIENIAAQNQTYVMVVATFYDLNGSVVGSDFAYTDPSEIGPGQVAPFELLLAYPDRVPLVASYLLTAESQEYAIVPEFPSITVLPFFMMLSLVVFALSKKTHIKAS